MLEGLKDVEDALKKRKIKFVVRQGSPDEGVLELAKDTCMVVCDMSYLRLQKKWRENVAGEADCLVIQVETEVVLPVELVSDRRERAARTLRPRLREHLDDFLVEREPTEVEKQSLNMKADGLGLSTIDQILDGMQLDRSVGPLSLLYRGGTTAAKKILKDFIKNRFDDYDGNRNQLQTDDVSRMSKYLHYGHVSPVYVALEIQRAGAEQYNIGSYLEGLIVRRELSTNFCHYKGDYDSFSCLPNWVKETFKEHKKDGREHVYTRKQFQNAATHDEYWKAAMNEMRHTTCTTT